MFPSMRAIADQVQALWGYRGFILGSVQREFQLKYRNSLLGAAWTIANPLAMIFVYTVIFSTVMQAKLPGSTSPYAYSLYLCTGILTWNFFAEVVTRGQNIFLDHANLMKKMNFPRLALLVIAILGAGINFFIIFGLFTVFLFLSGHFPGWPYLAIFPVLTIQLLFSVALAVILGVLNVFFRDVGHFFTIVLQFWFWLTPIVYPATILPERIKHMLALNPMAICISAYQQIIVSAVLPKWIPLVILFFLSLMLCSFALVLFRKHAGEMVDEL